MLAAPGGVEEQVEATTANTAQATSLRRVRAERPGARISRRPTGCGCRDGDSVCSNARGFRLPAATT